MRFELIQPRRVDLSGERWERPSMQMCACNFVGAAAVVAAVAVAAGASAYAASEQSGAEEDAQKANAKNMANTNEMNYKMFRESRGEGGTAIYPLYAKTATGQPFEKNLFNDALRTYDAVNAVPPDMRMGQYQDAIAPLKDAQAQANQTAAGIYNGELEQQALDSQQGVSDARLDQAHATGNAALISLAKTLNDIKAVNARRGFTGDSFGKRLMEFNAQTQAAGTTAKAVGDANVANATDVRGIKNASITARINNLSLPYAMSQQAIKAETLPQDAVLDQTARNQQIFNGFRIGTGQFQYQPLPQVRPIASTGQIVAQGVGSAASGIGSYYAAGQAANAYGAGGNSGVPTGASYGNIGSVNNGANLNQNLMPGAV